MAVTKIHGIKATVDQAIEYICNPAKTDDNIYISSFACAPETAALDFKYTLDHTTDYSSINGKNNENKAFHLIQAFEPGEVSYEEAHNIGKELANQVLEGKYSYVLTTHIDKGHVHNHIIFCAADNINHKHYHDCKKSYWRIRTLSDQLCQQHGLSVIEPSGQRGKKYNEWSASKTEQSVKAEIRKDINQFIKLASSYDEFIALMQAKGYEIKNASFDTSAGKYISFRPVGKERFIRGSVKSLGENYTKEAIKKTIEKNSKIVYPESRSKELLRELIITNGKPDFENNYKLQKWTTMENLKIVSHSYNQMLTKKIHDFEELTERISSLQQLSKVTKSSLVSIERKLQDLAEIIKYTKQYQEYQPFYIRYKKASDQDLIFRKCESQIILFTGAERMLQQKGYNPKNLDIKKTHVQYQQLMDQKNKLSKQYKSIQSETKELKIIKNNIKKFLEPSQHSIITQCSQHKKNPVK